MRRIICNIVHLSGDQKGFTAHLFLSFRPLELSVVTSPIVKDPADEGKRGEREERGTSQQAGDLSVLPPISPSKLRQYEFPAFLGVAIHRDESAKFVGGGGATSEENY